MLLERTALMHSLLVSTVQHALLISFFFDRKVGSSSIGSISSFGSPFVGPRFLKEPISQLNRVEYKLATSRWTYLGGGFNTFFFFSFSVLVFFFAGPLSPLAFLFVPRFS